MVQTWRATVKHQGKDKVTLSMPPETSERFAKGPMPREDLTRLVAIIVEEVLQQRTPKVAGEEKTSVGVPAEAQSSRRDTSTSHSEHHPIKEEPMVHRSGKQSTWDEPDQLADTRRVTMRQKPFTDDILREELP